MLPIPPCNILRENALQSFYLACQSNLGKKNVTWWFQLSSNYTKFQKTNAMINRWNKTTLLEEDWHYSVWETRNQWLLFYCTNTCVWCCSAENNVFEFVITDHFMQNWVYFWLIWTSNISLCKQYVVCGAKITCFYQFTKILTNSKSKPCEMIIIFEHWWAQNFSTFFGCQSIKKEIQLAMQWMLVNRMNILVQHKLRIFKRGIMKNTE